jgi:DNA-binding transcriptional MerR regulator
MRVIDDAIFQIPEYCRTLDEKDIVENAFNLIFAFDEIVALGYRESVNLAQIKTFVEMDSHEEKVFQAVRETQEKEAKQKMREKAKELQRQRMESQKKGIPMGRSFGSSGDSFGISSSTMSSSSPSIGMPEISKPTPTIQKSTAPKNALKLGGKSRDVDTFVDQLKSEGEKVTNLVSTTTSSSSSAPVRPKSDVPTDE